MSSAERDETMDLSSFRPWFVLTHVLAVLAFVLLHGASAGVAFRLRSERNPERVRALLELSNAYLNWTYGALMVLLLSGIGAGIAGGWWTSGRLWLWASVGLLVAVFVGMYGVAAPYFEALRHAVGLATFQDVREHREPPSPATDGELATLLDSRRPAIVALVGLGGISLITGLMVLKPF
jgi:hypothetical protein